MSDREETNKKKVVKYVQERFEDAKQISCQSY